jgi:hypothetical protein
MLVIPSAHRFAGSKCVREVVGAAAELPRPRPVGIRPLEEINAVDTDADHPARIKHSRGLRRIDAHHMLAKLQEFSEIDYS